MTVIDGVICVGGTCVINRPTRVSTVTLDWSGITGGYNTADSVVRGRRTK